NGELRNGVPEDLISQKVEVEYQPDTDCPNWKKFISEIFQNNQEIMKFVQKYVGYSFTGDTSEQCFFICEGSGSNGKSVFLDVLRTLAGSYGLTTPFTTFERSATAVTSSQSNDLAAMVGKRLIIASEVNQGKTL